MKNFKKYVLIEPCVEGYDVAVYSAVEGYNHYYVKTEKELTSILDGVSVDSIFVDIGYTYSESMAFAVDRGCTPVKFHYIQNREPAYFSKSLLGHNILMIKTEGGDTVENLEACLVGLTILEGEQEDFELASERQAGWLVYSSVIIASAIGLGLLLS